MPFLPLFDNNPRVLIRFPWITWGTIGLCVYVFFQQISGGEMGYFASVYRYGFIPSTLSGVAELPPALEPLSPVATLVTSLFLHGDFGHLLGNMLFLFVFGDNVEDAMGHIKFLVFYLVCGIAATLLHFLSDPTSTLPLIGASGAISGVLGAYLLLFPRAKVLVPIIIFPLFVPAYLLLILWFFFQILSATSPEQATNVAWWAHIGGFLVGMLLAVWFRRPTVPLFGGSPPRGVRLVERNEAERPRKGRGPWG